jgi:hypothetical protein
MVDKFSTPIPLAFNLMILILLQDTIGVLKLIWLLNLESDITGFTACIAIPKSLTTVLMLEPIN